MKRRDNAHWMDAVCAEWIGVFSMRGRTWKICFSKTDVLMLWNTLARWWWWWWLFWCARLNGQCRQHVGAWPQSQMLCAVIVVVVVVAVVMRIWWVCLWNCAFGCLLSFLCTLHLCKCCLYGFNVTYTMRPRRIASPLWHCMWHNARNAVNEFFNMIAIRDIIHNCSCAFVWLIWFVIVIIVEPKITRAMQKRMPVIIWWRITMRKLRQPVQPCCWACTHLYSIVY